MNGRGKPAQGMPLRMARASSPIISPAVAPRIGSPKNAAAPIRQDFYHPGGFRIGDGPVQLRKRETNNGVARSAGYQIPIRCAHVRQLRVGENSRDDVTLVQCGGDMQDGVGHSDLRHVLGHVRKEETPRDIAARIDVFYGSPGTAIDSDSLFILVVTPAFSSCRPSTFGSRPIAASTAPASMRRRPRYKRPLARYERYSSPAAAGRLRPAVVPVRVRRAHDHRVQGPRGRDPRTTTEDPRR